MDLSIGCLACFDVIEPSARSASGLCRACFRRYNDYLRGTPGGSWLKFRIEQHAIYRYYRQRSIWKEWV